MATALGTGHSTWVLVAGLGASHAQHEEVKAAVAVQRALGAAHLPFVRTPHPTIHLPAQLGRHDSGGAASRSQALSCSAVDAHAWTHPEHTALQRLLAPTCRLRQSAPLYMALHHSPALVTRSCWVQTSLIVLGKGKCINPWVLMVYCGCKHGYCDGIGTGYGLAGHGCGQASIEILRAKSQGGTSIQISDLGPEGMARHHTMANESPGAGPSTSTGEAPPEMILEEDMS
ncbi:hypothetical protein B0H10DRAFT_1945676 [Mycena sp. CBHHK59/15]|nr:hypothetical protein B0H10DRAFT_1945676 [Mycena sp. CBHHK59/15]